MRLEDSIRIEGQYGTYSFALMEKNRVQAVWVVGELVCLKYSVNLVSKLHLLRF